ncbi:hypothetical protein BJY04DRAFT_219730 [Aspergillus karnatakaensis]|uniref:uncharacterized protein n=1 Tax=Aspergillus karnatakaensis TaxID=1810916 RepID=UPI003CCCCB29
MSGHDSYNLLDRLPHEPFEMVIEHFIASASITNDLAVRETDDRFFAAIPRVLFRNVDQDPEKWQKLPLELRVQYLERVFHHKARQTTHFILFVQELLEVGAPANCTPEELSNVTRQIFKGIACGTLPLRDLLAPALTNGGISSHTNDHGFPTERASQILPVVLAAAAIQDEDTKGSSATSTLATTDTSLDAFLFAFWRRS